MREGNCPGTSSSEYGSSFRRVDSENNRGFDMTSVRHGARSSGWLIILLLPILFAAAMAAGQQRLGVPAYQDPGSAQWTAWALPGSKSVGIMIVNLDNGDDEHYYA